MKIASIAGIAFAITMMICGSLSAISSNDTTLRVGYSDFTATGSCPTYLETAQAGYNMIIQGFGTITGSELSISDSAYGPYWKQGASAAEMKNAMMKGISEAKAKFPDLKIFLSVGGENNTYKTDPTTDYATLANNIVNVLKSSGFDGIDFDLEIVLGTNGAANFEKLVTCIKAHSPETLVSIAPQSGYINTPEGYAWRDGKNVYWIGKFVTTQCDYGYDQALNAGKIDYVFCQFYNQPNCYITSDEKQSWQNGFNNTQIQWVSSWIDAYNRGVGQTTLPNPPTNKFTLVVGLPSSRQAAGTSIWTAPSEPSPGSIRAALQKLPNYKGAMTWSTNDDKANKWRMVSQVMP
jgi:chitinase